MHKITNKLLSALLMLAMVIILTCISAFAAEVTEVDTADELKTAIAAGGNIKLTANIELNELVKIEQAVSIDGAGFTITGSAAKVFEVYANANFTNVTIVNTANNGRCVDTRVGGITLNLTNVNLNATEVSTQPLTIGGDARTTGKITVNISNCTINAGESGYAIITYNPVTMSISDNSFISGYGAMYFKGSVSSAGSSGSVINVNRSTIHSKNIYIEDTNSFATIIFEDNDISVNVDSASTLSSESVGKQSQCIFGIKKVSETYVSGIDVFVDENATLNCDGENGSRIISHVGSDNTFVLPTSCLNEVAAFGINAQIAETGVVYASLTDALAAASASQTINVLADVVTDNTIAITKSVTINGNNHSITSSNKKAVTIENAAAVVINDLAITTTYASDGARCIGTYNDGISLTLNRVSLASNAANGQTLTLGGSSATAITVSINDSSISGGNSGYGILAFVPSNLTITGSIVSGYSALYFKEGSDDTYANVVNSTISSVNTHSGESNAFGTFVFETDDVVLNVDADSEVTATATGDQPQFILNLKCHTDIFVDIQGPITTDNYINNLTTGNNIVLTAPYADAVKAEGYHAAYGVTADGVTGALLVTPHVIVHVEAAEEIPCQQAGHIEHWTCDGCNKYYADAEGNTELSDEDVFIGTGDHSWTETAAVAPTCAAAGNYKYRTCNNSSCTAIEIEKDGEWLAVSSLSDTVLPVTSHSLTEVPAAEATYTAAGNIKYYTCVCGKWFSDEAGQTEITDKASVVIPQLVEVQDTTASVAPEAVDKAVEEANFSNSDEVVIELTTDEEHKDVTAVELPVASVDKIADANKDLTVSTPEVTVTLDTKTLETIAAAVNRSDATVTLEVVKIETEELNAAQKDAIADLEVAVTISASLIADNTSIHDFNGGNVTVRLPFTPAEGTNGSDYKIYYIANDGSVEELATTFENGQLVFVLTHFSEYVVVNTKAATNPQPQPQPQPQPEPETTPSTPSGQDSPAAGDFSNPAVLMIAMLLSAFVAATMTYNKKRA